MKNLKLLIVILPVFSSCLSLQTNFALDKQIESPTIAVSTISVLEGIGIIEQETVVNIVLSKLHRYGQGSFRIIDPESRKEVLDELEFSMSDVAELVVLAPPGCRSPGYGRL